MKRRITSIAMVMVALTILLAAVLPIGLSAQTPDPTYPLGDVNHDGRVTVVDALFIAQVVAELRDVGSIDTANGDVNGDGELTIVDALWICQYKARLRDATYNWIGG